MPKPFMHCTPVHCGESAKVRLAESSDAISPAFVDEALTIDTRVLNIEPTNKILQALDDKYGLPRPRLT